MLRSRGVLLAALVGLAFLSLLAGRCGGGSQKNISVHVGLPAGALGVGSAGFELDVPEGADVLLNNTTLLDAGAGGLATADTRGAWNALDGGARLEAAFIDPVGLSGPGPVVRLLVRVPAAPTFSCDDFPILSAAATDLLAVPLPGSDPVCTGVFE